MSRPNGFVYHILTCTCLRICTSRCCCSEIWSETTKSLLVLVLQVWCCVVKHGHVKLVVILKDTAFQVLFIVSLFCAWNITSVGSTVAFTYFKVKCAKCLRWSWSCFFGLDLKNLVFLHYCCCFMLVSIFNYTPNRIELL